MPSHQVIDERSLAFGRAIADRLATHPQDIQRARENIERWLKSCSAGSRPALEEWSQALHGPLNQVIALLTGTDQRSTRLRQSNPFAGVLPESQRLAILRKFQT